VVAAADAAGRAAAGRDRAVDAQGVAKLQREEAAAVASLFVKSLGGGAPLPAEFQVLLETAAAGS
jgi:hypothetical protein